MKPQPPPNASLSHTAQTGQYLSNACVAVTFGESFVSQRLAGEPARYTFSACRGMRRLDPKDSETGYSYFGARYYESGLSVWLSVDPLSDKYPSLSSYVYCANNPVILVDPDGRDWVENENGSIYWDKNATSQKTTKTGETYLGRTGQNFDGTNVINYNSNGTSEIMNPIEVTSNIEKPTSTTGNIFSMSSAITGAIGELAENSNTTFRVTNSKGKLDFKLYESGWKGNQWVTTSKMSKLGKNISRFGSFLGIYGIYCSCEQFQQATNSNGKLEHGFDLFIGGLGHVPVIGQGLSLYWSFGGKKLHYKWAETVLPLQMEMSIDGLPATIPSK